MSDRRATLFVGVEGWQEAAQAADKVNEAWNKAGQGIGAAFSKVGGVVGGAVTGMISDMTRLLTVSQGISFAKGIAEARAYTDALGRMSASSKMSVASIEGVFDRLSKQKLVPEKDIATFTGSMRRLTYDAKGAMASFAGLADEAVATGKSANDMVPLGVLLHNTLGITDDTTAALGRMRSQADMLGTIGGPAALHDTLMGISGMLDNISDKTPNIAGKMSALAGGFGGRDLKPMQRQQALSSVLGKIEGDQFGWIHTFLGRNLSEYQDAQGRLKDPSKLLADVQKKFKQRYGTGAQARTKAELTFGSIGGMALLNTDFAELGRASVANPSIGAAQTMMDFANTPAGKQLAAEQAKARAERKIGNEVNPAITGIQSFVAEHPVLGTLGLGVGGQLFGAMAGGAIKSAFGAAGAGSGGAAGGGWLAGALASPIAPVALGMGGVMGLAAHQEAQGQAARAETRATADLFNVQNPADEQAAQFFGTDFAREHKAVMRRGQMMVAAPGVAQLGSFGTANVGEPGGKQQPIEIANVKDLADALAAALNNRPINVTAMSQVPGVSVAVDGQLAGTPKQ